MSGPRTGDMRVWWIPQLPGKAFHVSVESPKAAQKIMNVLADYDIFQYENKIKPDYCNTGGLEIFEDGEWYEWESEDGNSIDDFIDLGDDA